MKRLNQFCAGAILMIALAFSAFASDGQIPCEGITSPPPESTTAETTTDGHIDCGLTQAALTIIQSILLLP